MTPLLELQRTMRMALLGDGRPPPEILGGKVPAAARFHVYRNNVIGNLIKALRLTFPATERLVGSEFFAAAAARLITQAPPRSADLYEYGDLFPRFLQTFPPSRHLAYLPEVARLEWAVNKALHAPRLPALKPVALTSLPEGAQPDLVLLPDPSLTLLQLAYPSSAIWKAVLAADAQERAQRLAAVDLRRPDGCLAVLHSRAGLALITLSEPAFAMARALIDGVSLADALAAAPPEEAAPLLASLFSRCLFVGYRQSVIETA